MTEELKWNRTQRKWSNFVATLEMVFVSVYQTSSEVYVRTPVISPRKLRAWSVKGYSQTHVSSVSDIGVEKMWDFHHCEPYFDTGAPFGATL